MEGMTVSSEAIGLSQERKKRYGIVKGLTRVKIS